MKKIMLSILMCIGFIFANPVQENGYYLLYTKEDLQWASHISTNWDNLKNGNFYNYKLMADIDYGGDLWLPICAGKGDCRYNKHFEGNGHKISNLVIDGKEITDAIIDTLFNRGKTETEAKNVAKSAIQNLGFIGTLYGGKLTNLTLENITVRSYAEGMTVVPSGELSIGTSVGWFTNGSVVDGVIVTGTMEVHGNKAGVGGVVGYTEKGTVMNSMSSVSIVSDDTSNVQIGGISGYTKDKPNNFNNVIWNGEVMTDSTKGNSGGIIGYAKSDVTIENAYYNSNAIQNGCGAGDVSIDESIFTKMDYLDFPIKITDIDNKKTATIDGTYKHKTIKGLILMDNTADTIIFNRQFPIGIYSTLALPFDIPKEKYSGFKTYKLHSVKKDSSNVWKVYITENEDIVANKPYIIIPSEETLTIKGQYEVKKSYPDTTLSEDGNWVLTTSYDYIIGSDFGDERQYVYGFAGKTTETAQIGQFVKAGKKATIMPFRVYLKYLNNDINSLNKSSTQNMITKDIPDSIAVEILHIEDTMTIKSPEYHINDRPMYYKYNNGIEINHNDRLYNLKGEVR